MTTITKIKKTLDLFNYTNHGYNKCIESIMKTLT